MWLTLQPFILSVVGLPATVYVIRCLGPEGFGQWSTATALVGALAVITSFGFRPLFTRDVAQRPESARNEVRYQLGLRTALGLVAFAAATVATVALGYPRVVLLCTLITGAAAIATGAGGALEDLLQGFQELRQVALVALAAGLTLTALSALVAFLGGGPVSIAIAYAVGPAVSVVLLVWYVRTRHFPVVPAIDLHRFSSLLRGSRILGAGFLIASVRDRAEGLLVPKLLGITTFGHFAGGLLLADRLAVIPSNLTTAFFPLIAQRYHVSEASAAIEIRRLLVLGQVVCVPMCLLATFHAAWIAGILFRSPSALAGMVISLTIWALPLQAFALAFAGTLQATGSHDAAGRANLLTSLVSLPVSVCLVASLGVLGASISWVVRAAIAGALNLPPFLRRFSSAFSAFPAGAILLGAAVMAAVELLAAQFLASQFMRALVGGGLGAVSYLAVLLSLRVIRPSDLRRLRAAGNDNAAKPEEAAHATSDPA